jgi:hypothetical protein
MILFAVLYAGSVVFMAVLLWKLVAAFTKIAEAAGQVVEILRRNSRS